MKGLKQKTWWALCVLATTAWFAQGCGPDMWTVGKEVRNTSPMEPGFEGKFRGGGWGEMSFEERKEQMEREVYPAMFSAFRLYDEHKYKEQDSLHCMSCHGLEKSETDFSKPSKLFPLDPTNLPARNHDDPRIANAVRFMEDTIVPQMSQMLGREIGCFSCHASTTGEDLRKLGMSRLKAMQQKQDVLPQPTNLP
ncbi:MAG: hypothetical protein H6727_11875 [Myxococcales bacterium]|nr:hypothetical protein [Myxococcales bacterium]